MEGEGLLWPPPLSTRRAHGPPWFHNQLEFKTKLIPYEGDDSWVEPTLVKMKACMDSDDMPPVGDHIMGGECEYCAYARERAKLTVAALNTLKKPH